MRTLKEALEHRRSYYAITAESPLTDRELEELIGFVLKNIPSAYNSQSTRLVLLLGESHKKLWEIVKACLKEKIKPESYEKSEQKINSSFESGYGTVLFFEDQTIVRDLQQKFPLYRENFPIWSQHTSAMHQLSVWTLLEDAGFGASLQHYNPLIDEKVRKAWDLPDDWQLLAQMPFGVPLEEPGPKKHESLEKRMKVFR